MTNENNVNDSTSSGGVTGGFRPGSPVMPMRSSGEGAGSAGSDHTGAATTPLPAAARKTTWRSRRRVLATVPVVAVGLAGFGIGHAFSGSSSSVETAATTPGSSVGSSPGLGAIPPGLGNSGAQIVPSVGNSGSSGSVPVGNSGGSGFGSVPFGGGSVGNSGTGSFGGGSVGNSGTGSFGSGSSSSGGTSAASGSPANASAIAAKVAPALVDITSTFSYQSASGAGTGIVLTANGEVITNNHVINGATKISVRDIGNNKTYSAVVKGYDATHDIAVLQLVNASGLTTATVGDSSAVTAGNGVVAVGNAGGVGGTPSSAAGSITAIDQSISASDELNDSVEQLTGLLATNADIQPGDSGGALVDANGAVIGVNTAGSSGYSFSGTSGQGFAIPINTVIAEAKAIEAGNGSATIHVGETAFLGVTVLAGSDASTGGFGQSTTNGALVRQALSGSAAAAAGIVAGDTLTSLDGQTIASPTDLSHLLVPHHPGDKVAIGYVDSAGASHTTTVTLASGPPA